MQTHESDVARRAGLPPALLDQPHAWLAVLERARAIGDYELAALADAELRRLGVHVRYDTPRVVRREATR
jgi:hypothetical protein